MMRFPDVFEGIGKFLGKLYEIQLVPNVPPRQTPCRPVPIHLKDTFKKEINKMLKAGVLKPYRKQHHGSTALCMLNVQKNMGSPNSRYA